MYVQTVQKLSMGMTGISRAELPSWSQAELTVGGGWRRGVWGALPPETNHLHYLHTCQSIFNFCLQSCWWTFWRC